MLMGPQSANELATSWIPNIIFFLLFVAFGLSLIGFYELTVPSSFITLIDKKSQQGGFVGIFFMAFTLVLVSFSCTVYDGNSLLYNPNKNEVAFEGRVKMIDNDNNFRVFSSMSGQSYIDSDEVWDSEVRYLDNSGYFLQIVDPIEDNISISLLHSLQLYHKNQEFE